MGLEGFKSAWLNGSLESDPSVTPVQSHRFSRTWSLLDLDRSEHTSRLIFSLLFALVAAGTAWRALPPGTGRILALMLAAALLVDGLSEVILLVRRLRRPVAPSLVQFLAFEHRLAEVRSRFEHFSQAVILVLAAAAIALLWLGPSAVGERAIALDGLARMAIVTAFLAVAWRRVKACARSREVRRELRECLQELEE